MKQAYLLNILYDLSLSMGGETREQGLIDKMLQRLMFHTAFPCGLFIDGLSHDERGGGTLLRAIGSQRLKQQEDRFISLPSHLLGGKPRLVTLDGSEEQAHALPSHYRFALVLPVEAHSLFLLLGINPPDENLPVDTLFQPVLANFAKALQLCRHHEAYLKRLEQDRARAESEKRERERLLQLILQSTAEGILGLDPQGCFSFANAACLRMLGYEDERELLGQDACHILYRNQALQDAAPNGLCSLRHGERLHCESDLFSRRSGECFPVEYWIHPIYSEGELMGSVITFLDISERLATQDELRRHQQELEQRVAERTAALAAANKELEAFSYSVSHDLRAPLRAIDGFSQALEEDLAEKLEPMHLDYLRRVRRACGRMSELIDDLLKLSRISRHPLQPRAVDLAELARDIGRQLQENEPQRTVSFHIQKTLPAHADPHLMHIALFNLLENAWKYTARKQDARVEVGMSQQQGQRIYFVRDNGVGFDMRYAGKLFGAFQRLHRDDEFPGTGIGLATVARIIHSHQGRIWAQAEPGRGASFFFTLAPTPLLASPDHSID